MKSLIIRAVCALSVGGGMFAPAAFAAEDEFEGLPAGPGQEITFYTCSACHSIKLVNQQRLTRESWDGLLVYMVEEQAMDPLEPADRKEILDYLGTYLGQNVPR